MLFNGLNLSVNLVGLTLLVQNMQSDRSKNRAYFRKQPQDFLVYSSIAACQINRNLHFCIYNFARKLLGRQVFMCLICRLLQCTCKSCCLQEFQQDLCRQQPHRFRILSAHVAQYNQCQTCIQTQYWSYRKVGEKSLLFQKV